MSNWRVGEVQSVQNGRFAGVGVLYDVRNSTHGAQDESLVPGTVARNRDVVGTRRSLSPS